MVIYQPDKVERMADSGMLTILPNMDDSFAKSMKNLIAFNAILMGAVSQNPPNPVLPAVYPNQLSVLVLRAFSFANDRPVGAVPPPAGFEPAQPVYNGDGSMLPFSMPVYSALVGGKIGFELMYNQQLTCKSGQRHDQFDCIGECKTDPFAGRRPGRIARCDVLWLSG